MSDRRFASSRITIAFIHRMPMTLKEIIAREDQLYHQITECKRLLAAYRVIRAEAENSRPIHCELEAGDATAIAFHPESLAPALPPPAPLPVPPQPNLEALSKGYGGGIRLVTWAIRQLTCDFGVREIASVLREAGHPMGGPKLSVILNRMKDERKITEIRKGRGRTPSLYRATAKVTAVPLPLAARYRSSHRHLLLGGSF